ncbi:S-layer homology domain-containing protein [Paenibacillus tritici]|uniref:S-layer homology domain-containing protein n=1 Tax=Paenibacillus tritici TaxID=1873425 RepID=UPI001BAD5050|nr:S-layer homology domain-containing protein [Paenibacillus tritici]QUL55719.1 S-layer homology domain-containing protein [Paenibacillus tritici]
MLSKFGKIGLALVLVIGLLPMVSLRAYAALPTFNETLDFVIEPPVSGTTGKTVSDAQGLQDGSTAVLLNSFVYQGNTYTSSNFLRIYNSTGTLTTDVNLGSLMDTYYKMTYVSMLALSNGNLLITYSKSDSNENNLQLGTVTESTPNAYFMVLNKAGQKVTGQTQLNTFSAGTLPQLTRFVSAAELSDGNIAFSWQRNDNKSTVTRVFTAAGVPVSSETLLVDANASMSYVAAGDGVYMVAYNSGAPNDNIYLKLFHNNGTPTVTTINVGARMNERQLYLSTLGNGNFMFSQYHWQTGVTSVSLYDNTGAAQGGFTMNGSLAAASAVVYKKGAMPGFVTVSTDAVSNKAIDDAYNYGTEWSGTQYAYLNYYDYNGNLLYTTDQPVDSAPVVFQGYDEDSWMFAVEYYPKFSIHPTFGDKLVFIRTDNTDDTHYRITGRLFATEISTPVVLQSAVADGVPETTTSTKIDLTFDPAIAGLTADDITITGDTGSAVKGALSGSGTAWSIALTSVEKEGDVSVAVNSPSGYTISGSPLTATVSLFKPAPEVTPTADIDYAAEQLTGLTANGSYTVNGASMMATAEGKLAIDSSWLGTSLSIVKKGNGSTTIDSAAQTLVVASRPAAPADVAATAETAINANNGTLVDVTPAMEYKKGSAGAWTVIADTTVTGLAPDTYYVRTKATATAFASEAQTVTVNAYVAIPEATPAADLDYVAEQLTDLVPNGSYTVNGTLAVTATAEGRLVLDSSWLGTTLSIVKKGNGSTTIDSAAQTLVVASRPAAPADVAATAETAINANNGTLVDVTPAMEYKKGAAGAWTDVAGTTVTGLAPDTYYVRTKATATAFASEAQTVRVAAYVAIPEATPAANLDYVAEQLASLAPNGSYTINGTLAVTATAEGRLVLDSSWFGTSLSIVKKGNGSTTIDSAAQTLVVASRPAAPVDVAATDETAINANNGTLVDVTPAMEYKKGAAGAWTDVAGTTVTGLAPDTYYVRTKVTATAFTSASVPLTVMSFTATAEVTPAAVIDFAAEQLSGLTPDGLYTVNGMAVTAATDGTLAVDNGWLGTSLSIVKLGNGVTTTDSDVQLLTVPARQAAPVGVSVTDVTYNGANDGTLQNLTVQMEYRAGSAGLWTEVIGTTIAGLAPDTYYVRVKATATDFASNIAQVTVHDSDAVIPSAPEVAADDQSNTIIGLNTSMEFAVDDGPYVRYDGTNLPDLGGEHTVKVRVAASGSVPAGPATMLTFTTNVLIPAEDLSVSASDPGGAANNGYTLISVTPAPAEGHKLLYKNFGPGSVSVPNAGDLLSGYTLVGSEGLIPAADGDTIGIAEVDADGKVVRYGSAIAVVAVTNPVIPDPGPGNPGSNPSSGNPSSGTPAGNPATTVTDVIVLVNGKQENAGKATTTTSGNVRITNVVVDPARLQAKLDAEGDGAVVTIPVMLDSNIIIGELNGQMIKNMEELSATLVLQTSKGTYTLPASQINIGALAARLGNGVKLEDITLKITIGETSASMNQVVTAAAGRNGFTLVAPALDFTVTATSGTATVEVSQFNAYVERTVALPQGIDPNRITTGIVVDPVGTVRHVPTRLIQKDGRYYAEINSLTNSSYAIVWHPLTFQDVDKHWAKNAVNDMGSRLVINGVNDSMFNPNADITRAEFAAIIVRGLGLKYGGETAKFADVPADSWYATAVETASWYGLITGFEDGTFRPDARITREQAMNIIAKAMKLTGLAEQSGTVDTAGVLAAFTDAGRVGAWAKDSLALAASAGLITGRGGSKLDAKANVTRAEVAVLIQRLLQKSELID